MVTIPAFIIVTVLPEMEAIVGSELEKDTLSPEEAEADKVNGPVPKILLAMGSN